MENKDLEDHSNLLQIAAYSFIISVISVIAVLFSSICFKLQFVVWGILFLSKGKAIYTG